MSESENEEKDERRRLTVTEGQVVRWLCYAGFFYCAVSMVTALSSNQTWMGYLLGAVMFGIPALRMYVLYQERERDTRDRAAYKAQNAGAGGRFKDLP